MERALNVLGVDDELDVTGSVLARLVEDPIPAPLSLSLSSESDDNTLVSYLPLGGPKLRFPVVVDMALELATHLARHTPQARRRKTRALNLDVINTS